MSTTFDGTEVITAEPDPAIVGTDDTVGSESMKAGPSGWREHRLVRGREEDPAWVRPSLVGLLTSTAVLYLWGLAASGWANSYYSAAVQAGSKSWKAMFFGSFDASNFITVDKTPASLWVMDLSARIFGYNAWSVLAPQALEGVAAVGLLYLCVRRVASPAAALLAGAVMALTPVAVLMFRFNNPDALLVLFLVGSAYATIRALEKGSTRWLALAAACIGFGFLTKMLQALILVPVLGGVYLLCGPTTVRRRIKQLVIAGLALVASAGWWIAIVSLVPASMRPYIGGSQHNSILELTLGYNGLGRLTGNETGSVTGGGGGAAGGSMWGTPGITRLFGSDMGTQISWLLPAALIMFVGGLWFTRFLPRNDIRRASLLLWGGWLVITGVVFSFAKGIIHAYYTVALAPAIGAIVGIMAVALWDQRHTFVPRMMLAATVAVTSVWCAVLLHRSPTWHPEVRTLVLLVGLAAAALIAAYPYLTRVIGESAKHAAAAVASLALLASLAGPAAASLSTAATPHTGAIPTAGPATVGGRGGPGGGRGFARRTAPPNGFGGQTFTPPNGGFIPGGPPGFGGGGFTPPGGQGGIGNLLDSSAPNAALLTALKTDASKYTWVAAAVGANSGAGAQIASGLPVMAIGGFNGSDPTPSLAVFQSYVAKGQIHYFLGGGGMGRANGGSRVSSEIAAWVAANYTASDIGGVTVYDLTTGAPASTA